MALPALTTVLIDGYALSDGSQRRGVGTYLRRLLAGLGERQDVLVKVLVDPSCSVPAGVEPILLRQRAPGRFRNVEHDLVLPYAVRKNASDVFHSPAQHPPRRSAAPWFQTLHDLIPLTRPHPLLARDQKRWIHIGPRLRRASAVVAVSRFSADEGIRHLDLDPRRVYVIPPGVDRSSFHPGEPGPRSSPYLLHVAAWGPHKGFAEALAVLARLANAGLSHGLIMAGPQDPWMLSRIRAAVAASPYPERVEVAGYVDDLPSLYRGATALMMTSRCEGFGLPALEAMACGTPVVAFANSSLPEVIGDGGALVPDGDLDAMFNAIKWIAEDAELRKDLSARGLAQAARFSWEQTIASHAELIRAVAS